MRLDMMSLQERRSRSALLIVVPEVGQLIDSWRRDYTADGASVPAHITLMCPFFAPDEVTATVRQRIARVVDAVPAFDFAAAGVERFPSGILYVTPEPVSPFLDLVARVRQEFHEVSPYWDQFASVIPHITIADPALAESPDRLAAIAAAVSDRLPVRCVAREVALLQRVRPAPAPWDVQVRFPLGASSADGQASPDR